MKKGSSDLPSQTPAPKAETKLPAETIAEMLQKAEQSTHEPARYENPAGAPVVITDARVKVISYTQSHGHTGDDEIYEMVTEPRITLVNNTDRRITGLRLSFDMKPVSHDITKHRVSSRPIIHKHEAINSLRFYRSVYCHYIIRSERRR